MGFIKIFDDIYILNPSKVILIMKKTVRLTEAQLKDLIKKVIAEQSIVGSVVKPDVVERLFDEKTNKFLSGWTSLQDLKNLYSFLKSLDGKKVVGVSKCYNTEWQNNGKVNTTVLNYMNSLNQWQIQNQCSKGNYGGPSVPPLIDAVYLVGTKTLGQEGDVLKKQIIALLNKNGVKGPSYTNNQNRK